MSVRGWSLVRAGWLTVAAAMLSPLNALLLIGVPLALLLLAFRPPDLLSLGLAVTILVLALGGYSSDVGPVWLAERAWALLAGGAFVAATALWSRRGVLFRGTLALGVASLAVAVAALAQPGRLAELDWWISSEIRHAATVAYAAVGALASEGRWLEGLGASLYGWVGFQQAVYPAFLGLATLAALGVASYLASRMGGARPEIGELREFRFSDHLVWVLVVGLLLLVAPAGGGAFRIGENATLFMGALYLLRGLAVLFWLGAALVSSAWAAAAWALLALLLYPIVAGAALVLGLGDTWLDLRERLRRAGFERS